MYFLYFLSIFYIFSEQAPTKIENDCSRVVSKYQRETDADIADYEDIDSVADVLQQSGYEVRCRSIDTHCGISYVDYRNISRTHDLCNPFKKIYS